MRKEINPYNECQYQHFPISNMVVLKLHIKSITKCCGKAIHKRLAEKQKHI